MVVLVAALVVGIEEVPVGVGPLEARRLQPLRVVRNLLRGLRVVERPDKDLQLAVDLIVEGYSGPVRAQDRVRPLRVPEQDVPGDDLRLFGSFLRPGGRVTAHQHQRQNGQRNRQPDDPQPPHTLRNPGSRQDPLLSALTTRPHTVRAGSCPYIGPGA